MGILGGEAYAATGNFDALAEAIDGADEKTAEKAIADANAVIYGETGKHSGIGSSYLKSVAAANNSDYNIATTYYSKETNSLSAGKTDFEYIGDAQKKLAFFNDELERLNNLTEENKKAEPD